MPKTAPYSKEFKREAVQLLRTSGRTVPQLAKELGVSQGSLRNWASQHDVDEGKVEGPLTSLSVTSTRPPRITCGARIPSATRRCLTVR